MSDLPEGYRNIPDEDRKKAQKFFDYGKNSAETGNFEYAIEMYLEGLAIDPDNIDAHQQLREISLKRKASGGKDLGMFEKMKLKKGTKDDKVGMLNAEKVLAYDPGDVGAMTALVQAAHKGGFYDTVMWMGQHTLQANISAPKGPDYKTFIILRDIFKQLYRFSEAVEACNWAAKLRPDDMDLQKELKDLGAQLTMERGKYGVARSFRDSIRDADKQTELQRKDSDIRTVDMMQAQILQAKKEWEAEPDESGKLMKYVEILRKTENADYENQAIEMLEAAYKKNGQFRWRKGAGEIKLVQLTRMERSLRHEVQKNPADEQLKKQYTQFVHERAQEELKEYTLWAENYPTETAYKFSMAARMFDLGKYDDAIPIFQTVRQDPKYRTDSAMLLGRSFLNAGYADEAVDTLRDVIESYQIRGDEKSIDMYYWYGRALEVKRDIPTAQKAYSQVAQWKFNYRDVQARIKSLRTPPPAPAQ